MPGSRKSMESVSHGRGGAGNIGADDTPYVDGEIVREGPPGDHGDGAYSTGRGGAANVGSPGLKAMKRNDKEVVPEIALRPSTEGDHHVGRGGSGNVEKEKPKLGARHPTGLADKLKMKLFGKKKAEAEAAATDKASVTTSEGEPTPAAPATTTAAPAVAA